VIEYYWGLLHTSKGGARWGDRTRIRWCQDGNEMMARVPRKLLGIEEGAPFSFHFKFADNTGPANTIEEFYTNGDTAPFGRFSFIYEG